MARKLCLKLTKLWLQFRASPGSPRVDKGLKLGEYASQEAVKQVANSDNEPEAEVKEKTELPLYGDRNPNWGEKDLPPRRSGS